MSKSSSKMNLMSVNAWDDSELIRAYDKAVKSWRKTGNSDENNAETPGPGPWTDTSITENRSDDNLTSNVTVKEETLLSPKMLDVGSWIIGSPCRAIYIEDGLEYEAKIIGIQGPRCIVRFVGYGNEESVNLLDLKTTHGKKTREKQRRFASSYQNGNTTGGTDELDECLSNISLTSSMFNNYTDSVCRDLEETMTDQCLPPRQVSTPRSFVTGNVERFITKTTYLGPSGSNETSGKLSNLSEGNDGGLPSGAEATVDSSSDVSSVPDEPEEARSGEWNNFNNSMPHLRFPIPPMPVSFSKRDGNFDFGRGEFPALLMSWYMAGYQAGFFDAKHELGSTSGKPKNESRKMEDERLTMRARGAKLPK